ncbi:Alpha/beta hydrolase family protein [Ectothiorhodospira mobilis]|uniref:Alpha/beta hydrolase family protein n=1 Tax=Ectothiorhodospira mobilis TaxID=195064 RepID=A0A1I4RDV7_ECTMO|nr:alpha/beta hydrolase [Ectothiorhodospira mobilis]SFM50120.1 Alpha/beta hydrolase family protein [Ectothiorhodospira mobilis]
MREAVVCLHGLWMTGLEMGLLCRRLRGEGFAVHRFRYSSILASPRVNAARLDAFLQSLDADVIHLVAHSLGGIVVLHLFHHHPVQKPGRIVMLGTPVSGSRVAAALASTPLTRWVLGRSIQGGLLGDAPRWKGIRELGMIAGSRGMGMGRLMGKGRKARGDGTIAVEETRISGLQAHLTVPCSHFGLLFSRPVARAVAAFLRAGTFEHRPPSRP